MGLGFRSHPAPHVVSSTAVAFVQQRGQLVYLIATRIPPGQGHRPVAISLSSCSFLLLPLFSKLRPCADLFVGLNVYRRLLLAESNAESQREQGPEHDENGNEEVL